MITETRKAELTAIIERRRQNPHEAPSPGDVVWLNHEEQIFFDALAAKLNLRDAATHAKQLEEKARDTRAAIREEFAAVKKPLAEIRSAITTEKERRSAAASKAGRSKKRSSQYPPEDLREAIAFAREKLRAGWKQQAACEEAIEHFTLPLSWKALMHHINKNKRKRTPK